MLGSHVLLPKRLRFSSLGHDGQSVTVSVVAGDEHDEIDEPPQPHTAERDELQNAQNDGAGIESVNAEGTLRTPIGGLCKISFSPSVKSV